MKDERDIEMDQHIPVDLVEFGTFEWPHSEARQTLGHLFEKVRTSLARDVTENAVDAENLNFISNEPFADRVRQDLASALQTQLDRAFLGWSTSTQDTPRRRAFVYPPMRDNLLHAWAERHDLVVLKRGETLSDYEDSSCVVLPDLAEYVTRDPAKLVDLFDLFHSIAKFDGKIIVGCNSWAWRFIKQYDDAHLLFDDVKIIPAFDATALASLLKTARDKIDQNKDIIAVASGDPILATDDDGALKDPYLDTLAGLSLGLPWVAIEMFLSGMAHNQTDDEADQIAECLWAALPTSCSLEQDDPDALLFALHALLIHGSRNVDDLNTLLAHRTPNGLWAELARKGFVEIQGGKVRCVLRNYPRIRSELNAAGFNLDVL